MVCTGAKHEEQCRQAARKYTRIIQKLGFPAKFTCDLAHFLTHFPSFGSVSTVRFDSFIPLTR